MTTLTGAVETCTFGTGYPTVLAAMLINTLKNEELARQLAVGNLDEVKRLAEIQRGDGVGFLQIMIAHPDLDEDVLLPETCKAAANASGLPLYIDSANLIAIRRTLDVISGKPLLSVNGDDLRLEPTLDLVKESGAAVICLCLDDQGIPDTVEGRLAVADKILLCAREKNIPEEDLVIDPLVMAAGAAEPDSMQVTLDALREIKRRHNLATFLGIDNAGFAMPHKDVIDLAYLLSAIPAGLDAALLEPLLQSSLGRIGLNLLYAANFISGRDPYSRQYLHYLRRNDLIQKKAASR